MGLTDAFTLHRWSFTLQLGAFAGGLALFTDDSTTRSKHC